MNIKAPHARSVRLRVALGVLASLPAVWAATAARNPARRPVVSVSVVAESSVLFATPESVAGAVLPAAKTLIFSQGGRLFTTPLGASDAVAQPLFTPDQLPDPLNISSLSASADSKKIAFVASPGDTYHYPTDVYAAFSNGAGLIKLTEAKTRDASGQPCLRSSQADDGTPLALGSLYCSYPFQPAMSPDGSRVVFKASETRWGPDEPEPWEGYVLYVVDSDGGEPVLLAEDVSHEVPVVWSPDSLRVYFVANPGEADGGKQVQSSLVRRNVADRESRSLALTSGCGGLAVSPDEGTAYCFNRTGLHKLGLEDGRMSRLSLLRLENPALSPDGRYILGLSQGEPQLIDTQSGGSAPLYLAEGVPDTIGMKRLASNYLAALTGAPDPHSKSRVDSWLVPLVRGLSWIDEDTVALWIGDASRQRIAVLELAR